MLHGRRKGKKLRSYQAGLIDDLLPQLAVDLNNGPVDPASLFEGRTNQIWLEIGFGGGEHLAYRAQERPDTGFLGCEPFINGAAKLLASIDTNHLNNIKLHVGDASELIDCLPDQSVDCICLLYPDPWPKRRQRKRRFVSSEMISMLARILRPGGEFRFATDIDDYAGWTLARVLKCPLLKWTPESAADWLEPWPKWPGTRYEEKAMAAGRPRCYLTFVRA